MPDPKHSRVRHYLFPDIQSFIKNCHGHSSYKNDQHRNIADDCINQDIMTYTELGGNSIEITLRVQIKILSNRRDSPAAQVCLLKDLFGGLFYFYYRNYYQNCKDIIQIDSLTSFITSCLVTTMQEVFAYFEPDHESLAYASSKTTNYVGLFVLERYNGIILIEDVYKSGDFMKEIQSQFSA